MLYAPDSLCRSNWWILERYVYHYVKGVPFMNDLCRIFSTDMARGREELLGGMHKGAVYAFFRKRLFRLLLDGLASRIEGTDLTSRNWALIRNRVSASTMADRDKVLRVIDGETDPAIRFSRLLKIDRGRAYRQILTACMPALLFNTDSPSARNWGEMERMVRLSGMPRKGEVLDILSTVPASLERENRLKAIDGGVTYREMLERFFRLSFFGQWSADDGTLPTRR
jgi:hypothetical protein